MPPVLKITDFQGEMPKIDPRLLPETAAQDALDVRLDDGVLTPVRKRRDISQTAVAGAQTVFKHDTDWLSWNSVVHAAPGPVATDRLYYTGDGVPKMRAGGIVYDLAMPRPILAVTATPGAATTGPLTTRVYAYTWVSAFGEESEPSVVSNEVSVQTGQAVTLSGFDAVPAGRNITLMRIYRTQTGSAGTFLYLIEERAASAAPYNDTVPVDRFKEPLPSTDWTAPPDDLEGLITMPNGMMAAFKGKQVYFCEPYRPHAWPEKYVITTSNNIVGLGAVGSTLVIMTTGQTQIAVGSLPEAMQMVKLESNFPCINRRSIVDLGYSICYASNEGLVTVDGNGQHALITNNMFNRDAWLDLSPSTMVCSQHEGKYVAFYESTNSQGQILNGMLLLNLNNTPFLTRSAVRATAVFYDVMDGSLNFVPPSETKIYRYDDPTQPRREMYWKSKEYVLQYTENFGAILIDGNTDWDAEEVAKAVAERNAVIARNTALILSVGGADGEVNSTVLNALAMNGSKLEEVPPLPEVNASTGTTAIRVYADKELIETIYELNTIVRLPSGFEARTWEIDVTGNFKVEQIILGRTVDDIARMP